ncbi:MAG: hypothetical protein OXE99_02985, partial [Cellvibrionales bacterium]|nr:hypothetical protein [Cellvibrionales bacterium]
RDHKKILDFHATYDSQLQLAKSTTWWINGVGRPRTDAVTYRYDSLKRLIAETHQADTEFNPFTEKRYQYDGNNNLLKIQELSNAQSKVTHNTYNASNQLTTIEENGQVFYQSYDLAGRLITDKEGNQYSYDAQNFLMSIQQPDKQRVDFDYYPTGLLKERQSSTLGVMFYYDPHANIIAEKRNGVESSLCRVERSIHAIQSFNEISPILSSNTSIKASFSDKPATIPWLVDGYGQLEKQNNDNALSNYAWLQSYTDFDTHLTYLNSRFYLQSIRQFLTPDKSPGMNAYNFGAGNPLSFPDLSGFSPVNYALGGAVIGLSAASVLWSIFAAPITGGSSLVASMASVLSGVLGIASGSTLIASQALADQGNTALSKTLMASSIGLGVGAAVVGMGGSYFAPEISDALGLSSGITEKALKTVSSASLSEEIFQAASIEKTFLPIDNLAPDPGDLSPLFDAEDAVSGSTDVVMEAADQTPIYLQSIIQAIRQGGFDFSNFLPLAEYHALERLGLDILSVWETPLTQYTTSFGAIGQSRNWRIDFRVGSVAHMRARQLFTHIGRWSVDIGYRVYDLGNAVVVSRIIAAFNERVMNAPTAVIDTLDSIPY